MTTDSPESMKTSLAGLIVCGQERAPSPASPTEPGQTSALARDLLSRRQNAPRSSQGAELKGEADPVLWPSSFVDVFKIVAGRCGVP